MSKISDPHHRKREALEMERDDFLKFVDQFSFSLPKDYGFKRNEIYERQEWLPNDLKVASGLAVSNQSGSI